MNKFYNTQQIISSNIKDSLLKVDSNIRKSQLNIIPFIIIGMILSESSTSSDIAKNQKSNGFYIENTKKASLKYFESMYTLTCFATLFLTIIGADYSKNTKKGYKNTKLVTHKKFKDGTKKRVMSLFRIGLTFFKLAYNSIKYIRIPFKFILYYIILYDT